MNTGKLHACILVAKQIEREVILQEQGQLCFCCVG